MKRLAAVLLGAALLTSGCGAPAAEDTMQDTLVIGAPADYALLQGTDSALFLTHETLLHRTAGGGYAPALAASWEFTDETHAEFVLQSGVTFSDGSPLTADDVKGTLEMAKAAAPETFAALTAIEVTAQNTFTLVGEGDGHALMSVLADLPIRAQGEGCGTGPYLLTEQTDEDLRFERNPGYWADEPVTDVLIFRIIEGDAMRAAALESGAIDVCIDPPDDALELFAQDPAMRTASAAGQVIYGLDYDAAAAPWDNPLVRQALDAAINRQAVLDAAGGQGKSWESACSPNRARSLLAEAGVSELRVRLLRPDSAPYPAMAIEIAENLAAVGIRAELSRSTETPVPGDLILRTGSDAALPLFTADRTLAYDKDLTGVRFFPGGQDWSRAHLAAD